jgi:hypothetical protein
MPMLMAAMVVYVCATVAYVYAEESGEDEDEDPEAFQTALQVSLFYIRGSLGSETNLTSSSAQKYAHLII